MTDNNSLITLLQSLLQFKSITGCDNGCLEFIASYLNGLGFITEIIEFSDDTGSVPNLFARIGPSPYLGFLGHSDVVSPVDESLWEFAPFSGMLNISNNSIYGRGAVDMKGAIAAFICAVEDYLKQHTLTKSGIAFLITADEEGIAINGTEKLIKHLDALNYKFAHVIVGEPTSQVHVGDMIKIGRRGSLTCKITITGKAGHVAYPHLAQNPIHSLVYILNMLTHYEIDQGTKEFEASNLEVVDIESNNKTYNVIPNSISAIFNIRFNNIHTSKSLLELIKNIISKNTDSNFNLEVIGRPCEPFLGKQDFAVTLLQSAIYDNTGNAPVISTNGGTSDARFMHHYSNVFELGLSNDTAHKINEKVSIKDLVLLYKIYYTFVKSYFKII